MKVVGTLVLFHLAAIIAIAVAMTTCNGAVQTPWCYQRNERDKRAQKKMSQRESASSSCAVSEKKIKPIFRDAYILSVTCKPWIEHDKETRNFVHVVHYYSA